MRPRLTLRQSLAALGAFWVVGICFLIAAWVAAVAANRFDHAPTCAPDQVFSTEHCRADLDGLMTSLTSSEAKVYAGGRHLTASVTLSGPIPEVTGDAVEVTVYQGRIVSIVGGDLYIDTDANPGGERGDRLRFAAFFMIGPLFLLLANLAAGAIPRKSPR